MGSVVKIGLILPLLVLLIAGCATKRWVQERLGHTRGEVDQRVGAIETQVGEHTEQFSRTNRSLASFDERVRTMEGRVTRFAANRRARSLVETTDVYFGFDRSDLSDAAQTALLSVIRELEANAQLTVDLHGYTDPAGRHEYNLGLSQRRVEAVRRFLVEKGVQLPRIYSVGIGPLSDGKLSDDKKRRVTVKLLVDAD